VAEQSEPLGLIAGEGELPLLVARNARAAGRRVAVVALRGYADPALRQHADAFCWRGVVQLGRWIRALRRFGCREVVMAGRVRKAAMFAGPRWLQWLQYVPDLTSIRLWYFQVRDRRNDTLLRAVADELSRRGLTMIDSTQYIPEALAEEGFLLPREPLEPAADTPSGEHPPMAPPLAGGVRTDEHCLQSGGTPVRGVREDKQGSQSSGAPSGTLTSATEGGRYATVRPLSQAPRNVLEDAEFAWPLVKQIAALDIGQSIAVKEREVIAVEAIEGTDALIERAGRLCPQGGWTLVKVARPNQDMRFDVPTIGPQTIENLRAARAAGLVVEAGRTIILERARTLELAYRYRIALIGRGGTPRQ